MSVVNNLVRLLLFVGVLGNNSFLLCATTPVPQSAVQGELTLVPLPGAQTPAGSVASVTTTTPDSSKPRESVVPAPTLVVPVPLVAPQPAEVSSPTPVTSGNDFEKLKTTIDALKKKSDEVRNQQKSIDALEDTMREAIKKMSDKINELNKELNTAHAARPDIVASESDGKAQEVLATIKSIYENVAQAIKDLESDAAKAVTGQAEKIRKEMSTVDEGTKKLQEQTALIQQTIEDIAKKQLAAAAQAAKKVALEVKAPVQQVLPAPPVPARDEKKTSGAPAESWLMVPVRMISWFIHAAVDFVKTLLASFRTAGTRPAKIAVDVPAQVEKQLAQAITPVKPAGVQQLAPAPVVTSVQTTSPAPVAAGKPIQSPVIPLKSTKKLAEDRSIGDVVIDLIAALVTKIQKMIAEVFPSAPVVPQEPVIVVNQPVEPNTPVMVVEARASSPVASIAQAVPVVQQKSEASVSQAHEEKKATPAREVAADTSEEKRSEEKPADEQEEDLGDKSDEAKDKKNNESNSEESDEATEEASEGNEEDKKAEE